MSEIQTTHRRVVLVHADLKTTERVVQTGRELDILNGAKIWMLLDGLLEGAGAQLFSPELSPLSLPNGMLAMRSRRRALFDARLLESVVELAGKATLNYHRNKAAWKKLTSSSTNSGYASSLESETSPFEMSNLYSPFSSSSLSSSSSSSSSSSLSSFSSPSLLSSFPPSNDPNYSSSNLQSAFKCYNTKSGAANFSKEDLLYRHAILR